MIIDNNFIDSIVKFLICAVALILSIILHELAHGYVALLNGDRTAKNSGRLTLDPTKHFDLLGLAMLLIIRVGYAKPVPVNPSNFKKGRLSFFAVSIAGIVVNALLSFIFTLFYILLDNNNSNVAIQCLRLFVWCVANYNLFLIFFNLLPMFPLDGYNMLESIFGIKNRVVKFFRDYGTMMLFALFLLSIIVVNFDFPSWLNLLFFYLEKTSTFVYTGFEKFWLWILYL